MWVVSFLEQKKKKTLSDYPPQVTQFTRAIIGVVDTVLTRRVGFRHLLWADAMSLSLQPDPLHNLGQV